MVFAGLLFMAAMGVAMPQQAEAATLVWPVTGHKNITPGRGFHSGHDGIDISDGSIFGASIKAAKSGYVEKKFTHEHNTYDGSAYGRECVGTGCCGYGTGICIRGDDGRWYTYGHMKAGSIPNNVYAGAYVKAGQIIGQVGSTGNSSGPHLHFAIHTASWWQGGVNPFNDKYIDDPEPITPDPATNVRFASTDIGIGDTVSASWGAGARATSYDISLQCTTNSTYNQSKTTSGTSISFTLSNPGTYKVTVTAKNSAGSSSATSSGNSCVVHSNCTVTYKDYDGAVLATKSVKWGGNSTAPKSPTREGYTFNGWSSDGKNIKSDTVITAQYTINVYTVKFEDYEGNAIGNLQRIEYKSSATAPTSIPTKNGYVFANWSTEDYKCVTKNLTVKAVYVWENVNLPIVTTITSARRNSDATGYIIDVSMTNFPDGFTTGKVVTALKTAAGKLVASDTRSVSPTAASDWSESITILYSGVASQVEVSVLGVSDDETTGTPKSKAVTAVIDLGEEWSDWSGNEPPTGGNILTETRTEYRSKTSRTITATSQPSTPSGYTLTGTKATGTYTGWGSWSGWSTSNPGSSTLREVGSRTAYRYFVFLCTSCGTRDDLSGACSGCGRNTLVWTEEWDGTPGSSLGGVSWGNRYKVTRNGQVWYYEKPGTANGLSGSTGQVTRTEYRYRTRSAYYDYTYWQTNFSDWQPQPITASSTCQVETRTAYRFKANSTQISQYNYKRYKYQNLNTGKYVYTYTSAYADSQDYPGEWEYNTTYAELKAKTTIDDGITVYNGLGEDSWYKADVNDESASVVFETMGSLEDGQGTHRNVTGTAEGAAGKVATLVVYKGMNTDPTANQIEYVGQTTIANDGSYSFDYVTKEEPSVKTGDFVITLGIEGATNYTNIGVIEAPKPSYVVEFVTDNGEMIGESQTVLEGGVAVAPEAPEKEGYEFVNWDTGLSNVHDNMVVTAVYKKKTCTVIFVDYDEVEEGEVAHPDIEVAQFEYGDELRAETVPTKLGKTFSKWVDADGNEVTTVTGDMVVEASYVKGTYTVRYLDWNGDVVSEQQIQAGEAAVEPTLAAGPSADEQFASWDAGGADGYVMKDLIVKPVAEFISTAKAPTFSMQDGSYDGAQTVSIESTEANSKLYYIVMEASEEEETNGSSGSTVGLLEGELYTGPITISTSSTILAYAQVDRKNNSVVSQLNLTIQQQQVPQVVLVDEITLDKASLNLTVGDAPVQLNATVAPENATNKGVSWRSSNTEAAVVSASGEVTAIGVGSATIIATARDASGVSAICRVTVAAPAVVKQDQIIEATDSYTKTEGDAPFGLDARLTTGDGTLSYISSNAEVAAVSDQGQITVGQAGTAIITVVASETDAFNQATKDIVVNVKKKDVISEEVLVTSIALSSYSLKLSVGDAVDLGATVSPDSATNKNISWTSTNKSVATVTSSGKVVARGLGAASIVAVALDGGGVSAICEVVVAPVEKAAQVITATDYYAKTEGDASFALDARVTKGDGVLAFESDAPSVAAVDATGTVSITGVGVAIITARVPETDGYKAAELEIVINVKAKPVVDPDIPGPSVRIDISKLPMGLEYTSCYYNYGRGLEPKVVAPGLLEDKDYFVYYMDNYNAGTATAIVVGLGEYAWSNSLYNGQKELKFTIKPLPISKVVSKISKSLVAYTGKALKPDVVFSTDLEPYEYGYGDYTLTYASNTNIGTASVTVNGKGNYNGTKKLTFSIVPGKAALTKVTTAKKSITMSFKAQKGGVKYQIAYRLGTGVWKYKTVSKTSVTLKNLKAGKKYTVRVRAFKKVGSKTYYGAWSASKTVKPKSTGSLRAA